MFLCSGGKMDINVNNKKKIKKILWFKLKVPERILGNKQGIMGNKV